MLVREAAAAANWEHLIAPSIRIVERRMYIGHTLRDMCGDDHVLCLHLWPVIDIHVSWNVALDPTPFV